MKEVFFLRHGKTQWSGKYIGASNVGLSSEGVEEVSLLLPFLSPQKFDAIFCSPLLRCLKTAELLQLQNDVKIDDRLQEINFGRWEKRSFQEINRTDPDLVQSWANDEYSFCFPEGESIEAFNARIVEFAKTLQSCQSEKILIVSHGGVIRHLLCYFLHLPFINYLIFQVETGKISTINLYGDGAVLTGFNTKGDLCG